MSILSQLKRNSVVFRGLLVPYRLALALWHVSRPIRAIPAWLLKSKEVTNFTYDLTPRNLNYLAAIVSHVTGCSISEAENFIREPLEDRELNEHITHSVTASPLSGTSDVFPRFAKRLGWYAFARATKPRLIVETGIDKGLGAVLLCAALRRNGEEGHPGRYAGTDINPTAGYLLGRQYKEFGTILYGDSIASLRELSGPIDLFINDSDHSVTYEAEEYKVIASKLSERAIILGDNSHCSDSLFRFARETGREFLFFAEQPMAHWYTGGGIGVCFPAKARLSAGA